MKSEIKSIPGFFFSILNSFTTLTNKKKVTSKWGTKRKGVRYKPQNFPTAIYTNPKNLHLPYNGSSHTHTCNKHMLLADTCIYSHIHTLICTICMCEYV